MGPTKVMIERCEECPWVEERRDMGDVWSACGHPSGRWDAGGCGMPPKSCPLRGPGVLYVITPKVPDEPPCPVHGEHDENAAARTDLQGLDPHEA